MVVPNNSLHELERQRLELEGNISKLQDSLYHWRTWEAEYDGLKEDIDELDDDATTDDFLRVGHDFGGSLVNEDEAKEIFGQKQGVTRSKQQVVDLITRRIDYVKQNASTMEKRLRTAENQLFALDAQEQLPAESTADFPMTEIFEELDENGDVISSKTSTPGGQATDLLEVLKKAGVKDIPDVAKADPAASSSSQPTTQTTEETSSADNDDRLQSLTKEEPSNSATPEGHANDNKPAAFDPSREVHGERPVTEVDESPEDAKLRQEMLQYSLNEVGSVVAELELDEEGSDFSVDDDYDFDDEDEEEDEHGRSTGQILSEDYHRQMRELEAKLNARGMWNAGKDAESLPSDVQQELEQLATVHVEQVPDTTNQPVKEKKQKKKVAFADHLDIAPAPKPPTEENKPVPVRESTVTVLADSVVERTEPVEKHVPTAAPKKVSRFKSARKTAPAEEPSSAPTPQPRGTSQPAEPRSALRKTGAPSAPSSLPLFPARPAEPKPFSQPISDIIEKDSPPQGPEGQILADKLVERDVSQGPSAAPEPDELDAELHKKEIATEFYRVRNRMIQQNGGFVGGEEPEIVPIETEDAPRRVSKFKAARMR
ncbi:hypothetical protein BO70DRAFT_360879 [Aspergillus heteromorphus CBS 117.55]|uniref:DUF3835 domain-containing protein n=1 Tax=Aspergillus heteromorphus CBS 117.55 TaxID=1448321 RepID=A0A317WLZ0_9EURO|nr:uncharacterized protein BO70DRAFT_360879 [Aspergillus heteromorphus CBS 117.55]PWY86067.1 hypothetical protein BO70DRAFT_360879 [Aspergillus heteromorphus CBS 117.55]